MEKEKRKRIILIAIIAILIVIIIVLVIPKKDKATQGGIKWSESATESKATGSIEIPAFNTLHFKAGETIQAVNLYNPKENNVNMIMQIVIDDVVIWESDEVKPDYGFTEIELNKPLDKGEYKARYIVRCFKPDGTEVNGGNIAFTLYVE